MIDPDPYSFRALWRQYRSCRRNKRNTINALRFEIDAEAELLALQHELRTHTYRPGRSVCFITGGPKPREVFAADFRDRVVHHLLVSHQEPIFERVFIHDSYACRKGKGTLAASDRLTAFLRRVTANGRRPAWALKLDVADFFPSIHKRTLYDVIAGHVRHSELRWLTGTLLFHDPTTDYHFRSRDRRAPRPGCEQYPVPARKSLFGKENERGLPIGNLTSQFWGNVYLDEVDQFVKRELRCRLYLRYVDDMVLLSEKPAELVRWERAIEAFLANRLGLTLRAEGRDPLPVGRGVEFVGWKTWWSHRVPRRRTVAKARERLRCYARAAIRPVMGGNADRVELCGHRDAGSVEGLRAALASYSGHLRHGAAWRPWKRLWDEHPFVGALFGRGGWAVEPRFPLLRIARARTFREQYWALTRLAGERCLVFCPVGRFVEFRGPQRLLATQALGLRSSHLPRAGFALAAGFPMGALWAYARRALAAGYAVVFVKVAITTGSDRCRVRLPRVVLLPTAQPELASATRGGAQASLGRRGNSTVAI